MDLRAFITSRPAALAHERNRHRVGVHAVARDAAGGVGGVDQARGGQPMTNLCNVLDPDTAGCPDDT